jgi:parvulin-like peptidyl-prolyl isomerase
MKPVLRALFIPALAALMLVTLALAASGCGGGGGADVPSGAIALVDGAEISRSELDVWIAQTKKSYQATQREFPKAGTPEYQQIQTYWVSWLVQAEELEQTAKELGLQVTEKDVDKGVQDSIDQKFDGSRRKLQAALKAQDFSDEMYRKTIRVSLLSRKIFENVTKDVTVPEQELLDYYNQNISTYQQKASRDVRHILIAEKRAGGQVDYAKSKSLADRLHADLRGGADFAAFARRYSDDTGSKDSGGKLTIRRGETVPEFDKTAFDLETGAISRPVKTTYGYHIIQALSNVKPGKTTAFAKARSAIRAQLLQQKKNEVMTDWVEDLNKKYKSKISYATGFGPPDIPDETSTETATQ